MNIKPRVDCGDDNFFGTLFGKAPPMARAGRMRHLSREKPGEPLQQSEAAQQPAASRRDWITPPKQDDGHGGLVPALAEFRILTDLAAGRRSI